jgi:hypothetical protein
MHAPTDVRGCCLISTFAHGTGSSGSHKSRMSAKLLQRLHEDSALELLLVMAQHTSRVCFPPPTLSACYPAS